jgi:hypothetical protein
VQYNLRIFIRYHPRRSTLASGRWLFAVFAGLEVCVQRDRHREKRLCDGNGHGVACRIGFPCPFTIATQQMTAEFGGGLI